MNPTTHELFHDLLSIGAANWPEHTMVSDRSSSLTYTEMCRKSMWIAELLRESGLMASERVIVWLPKTTDAAAAIFSASWNGSIVVPVNPLLKSRQLRHIIQDSGARHIISNKSLLQTLAREDPEALSHLRVVSIEEMRSEPEVIAKSSFAAQRISPDSPAAILYTSGSTGLAKGVVLSHENLIAGAKCVSGYLHNQESDVLLGALPLSFDAGLSQLTTAMIVGAQVHLFDYFLPSDALTAIQEKGITGITAVPTFWNAIANHCQTTNKKIDLRYIANTGGAMPAETTRVLCLALPKTEIFLMYGLTEAFRSTYLPPQYVATHPTSIGKPVPGAEVLVVKPNGGACEPFEHGELVHRGNTVALGYWNREEDTAAKFRPLGSAKSEHVKTVWSGDQAYTDNEGFIYFVGRDDDMIKVSGYRISPTEIEASVMDTGVIMECAAVGVPHHRLGQAIVLFASPRIDESNSAADSRPQENTLQTVKHALANELPRFMQPERVIISKALPHNANGKIDRNLLKRDAMESLANAPGTSP